MICKTLLLPPSRKYYSIRSTHSQVIIQIMDILSGSSNRKGGREVGQSASDAEGGQDGSLRVFRRRQSSKSIQHESSVSLRFDGRSGKGNLERPDGLHVHLHQHGAVDGKGFPEGRAELGNSGDAPVRHS